MKRKRPTASYKWHDKNKRGSGSVSLSTVYGDTQPSVHNTTTDFHNTTCEVVVVYKVWDHKTKSTFGNANLVIPKKFHFLIRNTHPSTNLSLPRAATILHSWHSVANKSTPYWMKLWHYPSRVWLALYVFPSQHEEDFIHISCSS